MQLRVVPSWSVPAIVNFSTERDSDEESYLGLGAY